MTCPNATTTTRVRLGVEGLERRDVPAITSAVIFQGTLTVRTNDFDTWVVISDDTDTNTVTVRDDISGSRTSFPWRAVARVDVRTGRGNDILDCSRLGTHLTADMGGETTSRTAGRGGTATC